MATHTCACGQSYVVDTLRKVAKPGEQVTYEARVPVEDIYGRRSGWRTATSGRWVPSGEPVTIEQRPDNGEVVWTYEWPCGDHTTTYEVPAYDIVLCRSCKGRDRTHGGYYYKQTICHCCGGNPSHSIRRDPETRHLPTCLAHEHNAA